MQGPRRRIQTSKYRPSKYRRYCPDDRRRSCRRTERIVFVTTKDYRGQDGGRVVVLPIARGQDIRLALARAGRHDFLAAAVTATLATAALTANVAPRVTIVLP